MTKEKIFTIKNAIEEFKSGQMLIVVDDKDRENEGDFIISAEKATPDDINFMMKHGRGLICTSLTSERAKKLKLTPMVENNTEHQKTNFTVSVDAKEKISTGISANIFLNSSLSPNISFNFLKLISIPKDFGLAFL